MDDSTRAVLKHVDAGELVDLASDLIRIPSFKTEETAVARFLEAFFRRRGYDVDLQEIEPGRFQTGADIDRNFHRRATGHALEHGVSQDGGQNGGRPIFRVRT